MRELYTILSLFILLQIDIVGSITAFIVLVGSLGLILYLMLSLTERIIMPNAGFRINPGVPVIDDYKDEVSKEDKEFMQQSGLHTTKSTPPSQE